MSEKLIETDVPVVGGWRAGLFVQLDAERGEEVILVNARIVLGILDDENPAWVMEYMSSEVKK